MLFPLMQRPTSCERKYVYTHYAYKYPSMLACTHTINELTNTVYGNISVWITESVNELWSCFYLDLKLAARHRKL